MTCTIHNTDNTPTLKLVKIVDNNDGGTAVANAWTLSADTAAVGFLDRNFSNAGGSGVFKDVYAGKGYDLAEDPNPGTGYTAGTWTCDKVGGLAGTTATLALGDQVTCTIITPTTPRP